MTQLRQKNPMLTAGRELFFFGLPLILSGILQQLYSWADAFIIGHVLGENALAAVGATSAVTSLLVFAITGFTLGLSIFAAECCGENRTDEIQRILSSFLLLLGGIFALLSTAGFALTTQILIRMATPDNMFVFARRYLQILFLGVPFLAVYNVYSALLRAIGDSKTPFYSVLLSSVLNVILDVLFVAVFPFGVAGAAAATVLSQIVMTVFLILYSTKKYPVFRFPLK